MISRRGSNAYKLKSRSKHEGIASLDKARHYHLVHRTGSIELMCPKGGNKRLARVDLSYLLAFPNLSEPIAQAIKEICRSKDFAYASCSRLGRELKSGFFMFLEKESLNNIKLEQLTTSHIEGFKTWLDQADRTRVAIYELNTREHHMSHLRKVVAYLKQSEKWAPQLASDLHIRPGMWAGQQGGSKPTPIIHAEDYQKIYRACKKEIIEITGLVQAMREALQANLNHATELAQDPAEKKVRVKRGSVDNPYEDLGVLLAILHHRYPRQILSVEWINNLNDRTLSRAIRERGIENIIACFYPTARNLVPFVLMMAIHLDYNKATLMGSKVGDYRIFSGKFGSPEFSASASLIEEEGVADAAAERKEEKLFRGAPVKKRSLYRPQERILPAEEAPDNPAFIWQFLVEWTAWFRPAAAAEWQDRLFLYVPGSSSANKRMRGFDGDTDPGADHSFNYAYKAFFSNHGLKYYSFKQFRPTGLDIVDVEFGGDIRAKQGAGGHATMQTTYQSYTTDAQIQRGDEALAQVSVVRERFRNTQGKSDPRRKPDNADVGAATPGWTCSDPYSSPLYEKNKLCIGYGHCPSCPLGSMTPNDCYSAAQAFNLLDAIDKAVETMAPAAWVERYGPSRNALTKFWLPQVPTHVLDQVREMKLPPLPPLE